MHMRKACTHSLLIFNHIVWSAELRANFMFCKGSARKVATSETAACMRMKMRDPTDLVWCCVWVRGLQCCWEHLHAVRLVWHVQQGLQNPAAWVRWCQWQLVPRAQLLPAQKLYSGPQLCTPHA